MPKTTKYSRGVGGDLGGMTEEPATKVFQHGRAVKRQVCDVSMEKLKEVDRRSPRRVKETEVKSLPEFASSEKLFVWVPATQSAGVLREVPKFPAMEAYTQWCYQGW